MTKLRKRERIKKNNNNGKKMGKKSVVLQRERKKNRLADKFSNKFNLLSVLVNLFFKSLKTVTKWQHTSKKKFHFFSDYLFLN